MSSEKDVIVVDGHHPGIKDEYTITTQRSKAHDSSVTFEE
jgi:hypothetical protein